MFNVSVSKLSPASCFIRRFAQSHMKKPPWKVFAFAHSFGVPLPSAGGTQACNTTATDLGQRGLRSSFNSRGNPIILMILFLWRSHPDPQPKGSDPGGVAKAQGALISLQIS